MSYLASNLKYLRKSQKINQDELAQFLGLSRTALGDYERGKTEPSIGTLKKLIERFNLTLDSFILDDLSSEELRIDRKEQLKILAISVDQENKENIELVSTKAEAGYLDSFSSPEYIGNLPKIFFPNIPQGTYRGFEIRGDSMLPMMPGSIVICKYIERLEHIKEGNSYIVVSKNDGVVYKRLQLMKKEKQLLLTSDNNEYTPYVLDYAEISEIWEYYAHVAFEDPRSTSESILDQKMSEVLGRLKNIEATIEIKTA